MRSSVGLKGSRRKQMTMGMSLKPHLYHGIDPLTNSRTPIMCLEGQSSVVALILRRELNDHLQSGVWNTLTYFFEPNSSIFFGVGWLWYFGSEYPRLDWHPLMGVVAADWPSWVLCRSGLLSRRIEARLLCGGGKEGKYAIYNEKKNHKTRINKLKTE